MVDTRKILDGILNHANSPKDSGKSTTTRRSPLNDLNLGGVGGGAADIYLAERAGPPANAQLTVEGTGGSNSTYIVGNNSLTGGSKFLDEGGNTSQVALGACGTFP